MSYQNKYHDLDKSISKRIMKEFKGKIIESVCPDCKGIGCDYCDNGTIDLEY